MILLNWGGGSIIRIQITHNPSTSFKVLWNFRMALLEDAVENTCSGLKRQYQQRKGHQLVHPVETYPSIFFISQRSTVKIETTTRSNIRSTKNQRVSRFRVFNQQTMSSNGFSIGTPGQTMLQLQLNCISLVCIIPYSFTAMLKVHISKYTQKYHILPIPFQKIQTSNGFSLCPYLLPIVYLENPFSPHEPRALHAPHPRLAVSRQTSRKVSTWIYLPPLSPRMLARCGWNFRIPGNQKSPESVPTQEKTPKKSAKKR